MGRRWVFCLIFGFCLLIYPIPARGYRPFISTDAAVADPKEIEVELGYFSLRREPRMTHS